MRAAAHEVMRDMDATLRHEVISERAGCRGASWDWGEIEMDPIFEGAV